MVPLLTSSAVPVKEPDGAQCIHPLHAAGGDPHSHVHLLLHRIPATQQMCGHLRRVQSQHHDRGEHHKATQLGAQARNSRHITW